VRFVIVIDLIWQKGVFQPFVNAVVTKDRTRRGDFQFVVAHLIPVTNTSMFSDNLNTRVKNHR